MFTDCVLRRRLTFIGAEASLTPDLEDKKRSAGSLNDMNLRL